MASKSNAGPPRRAFISVMAPSSRFQSTPRTACSSPARSRASMTSRRPAAMRSLPAVCSAGGAAGGSFSMSGSERYRIEPVRHGRHSRSQAFGRQRRVEALTDLRILIFVIDQRAPLTDGDHHAVLAPLRGNLELDWHPVAVVADGQLPGGLGPSIEVLMEPAARRAVDAARSPVELHNLILAPVLVRAYASFLGPDQDVSLRAKNEQHCARAMVVRLVIAVRRPIGHVADERVARHLELRDLDARALHFLGVHHGPLDVGDEVRLPQVGAARLGHKALVAHLEVAVLAGKAIAELEVGIEDELGIVEDVHHQWGIGYRHQPDRLIGAINEAVPAVERRGEHRALAPLEHLLAAVLLPHLGDALAVQRTEDFLEHVLLGLDRATGWDLQQVQAGDTLHAIQVHERSLAARAAPGRQLHGADVAHPIALDQRDAFTFHPGPVAASRPFFHARSPSGSVCAEALPGSATAIVDGSTTEPSANPCACDQPFSGRPSASALSSRSQILRRRITLTSSWPRCSPERSAATPWPTCAA